MPRMIGLEGRAPGQDISATATVTPGAPREALPKFDSRWWTEGLGVEEQIHTSAWPSAARNKEFFPLGASVALGSDPFARSS